MKQKLRLFIAFALIVLIGLILLFLAGLFPQERVFNSIERSLPQLETEMQQPYVLHNRSENTLDNFTDCLMLNITLYTNTRTDPLSILSNPLYRELIEGNEPDPTSQPYNELFKAISGSVPQATYPHYWMGYRVFLRPLLSFFNYMEVRTLLSSTIWLLFALAAVQSFRSTQNWLFVTLFALCFVSLNPIVVSGSLNYMDCFILAFIGMLFVPLVARVKDALYAESLLFLCIGAATQYFDFYTYPPITFAFPVILLLLHKQANAQALRFGDSSRLVGRCFLSWLCAYIGLWLVKLIIMLPLTDMTFANISEKLIENTIIGRQSAPIAYFKQYFETTLISVRQVLTPAVRLFGLAAGACWLYLFVRNPQKKQRLSESWVYLLVASISLIWIFIARRTLEHITFQYRIIGVLVLGISAFLARTAQHDSTPHT